MDFSDLFLNNLKAIDENAYLSESGTLDLNKEATKKLITDILIYYVKEFKLSGIKIDNMAEYSVKFINGLMQKLKKINPEIIVYGDGQYEVLNTQNAGENNLSKLEGVKMLNGSLNYALFGNLFDNEQKGVIGGDFSKENMETLKFALLSTFDNKQINYSLIKGVSYKNYWGNTDSYQLINNIGGRNGLSIYDKLLINNITTNPNIIKQKITMAFGTQMLSGGIPYIYSGNEFLVSYLGATSEDDSVCRHNSDFCFYVNEKEKIIDWSYIYRNEEIVNNFKSLINFRKANSVVQTEKANIINNVSIYEKSDAPGVIGYIRKYPNAYNGYTEKIFVIFNYSNNEYVLKNMESKGWSGLYNYNSSIRDGETIVLKPISLYSEAKQKQPKVNQWVTLILVVGVIGLLYSAIIMLNKRLVEKKGYDIEDINKKYRPFINKEKIKNKDTQQEDVVEKAENNEENKNGNN